MLLILSLPQGPTESPVSLQAAPSRSASKRWKSREASVPVLVLEGRERIGRPLEGRISGGRPKGVFSRIPKDEDDEEVFFASLFISFFVVFP